MYHQEGLIAYEENFKNVVDKNSKQYYTGEIKYTDYEKKSHTAARYVKNDNSYVIYETKYKLKNTQSVRKIMDYMEQDTDSEIRVTAGTDRYIFYIRCYEDRYYEFHVYDKKIGRDDKIYSSVSYARRNHSLLIQTAFCMYPKTKKHIPFPCLIRKV